MENGWREVYADWKGDLGFIGRNRTGGEIQIGFVNGKPGVGPMELLLLGIAGCTGIDIVNILAKKKQELKDMRVMVRGKRAESFPKVYTPIEMEYILWGDTLDPKDVEQAIALSEEKYFSASIMLSAVANITSSYKILLPSDEVE